MQIGFAGGQQAAAAGTPHPAQEVLGIHRRPFAPYAKHVDDIGRQMLHEPRHLSPSTPAPYAKPMDAIERDRIISGILSEDPDSDKSRPSKSYIA